MDRHSPKGLHDNEYGAHMYQYLHVVASLRVYILSFYSRTLHALNLSLNDKCALAGEVDGRGTSVSVLANGAVLNAFVKLPYAF